MGSNNRLKIAVLTSSRADFGIYIPLLRGLAARSDTFDLEIVAFGTHLSAFHDDTVDDIIKQGFEVKHRIPSMLLTDSEEAISTAYALTALKFAAFWEINKGFDWVICLGDRYEMAAAVTAGIPHGIRFAHIGGGDTTLGAIDNIYRHMITLSSVLHFVSLQPFAERVKQISGEDAKCVEIGSLGLDNLKEIEILSKEQFLAKWDIDLNKPTALVTLHPETVNAQRNVSYCNEAVVALKKLAEQQQIVITMSNADTAGSIYRTAFERLQRQMPKQVKLIENFGIQSYFSCMHYADYLLGNTSSGIIEAASFGKFVINIGDRQKGRVTSDNVIHVPFSSVAIIEAVNKVRGRIYTGDNLYSKGNATQLIINELNRNGAKYI